MRKGLYPRLAAVNIKNNRQTYLPYLFTCIGCTMMFYIMLTLMSDPALKTMSGGTMLGSTLFFGSIVIAVFSVILVFYANSFIIKQRKKEFGLYNILGMDKRHIGRVLLWETVYSALISFVLGIGLGILFSKLMQLALLKILRFDVRVGMYISAFAIGLTALLFAGIFLLTLLNSLRIIHLSKPVELLHGTQEGEREPKSKWLLAILGVIFLGAGYTMAIMTKSAVSAVGLFFVAVICVIIGTYLLFTAFSIVFLKRLRANRKYYYQTKHFATVSGMLYRMKKNAGGLASICILSTMVLVTVSTTVCLYMGVDEMLDSMYPYDISATDYTLVAPDERAQFKTDVLGAVDEQKGEITEIQDYLNLNMTTIRDGDSFSFSNSAQAEITSSVSEFKLITVADYNALSGKSLSLENGQALLYSPNYTKHAFTGGSMSIGGIKYSVSYLDSFPLKTTDQNIGWEVYCMVLPDENALLAMQKAMMEQSDSGYSLVGYTINMNLSGGEAEKQACSNAVGEAVQNAAPNEHTYNFTSRSGQMAEFLGIYGGLLFLGLFLGLMFLMATVLIIYYKQVTEGYDDRERFRIMQNVGMTKSEVKSTIHSQVLIVFFLPLVATVIHIAFAFPMIRRILSLFQLTNLNLFVGCTLGAIGIFAVLYTLVYMLTARAYYKIVS